MRLVIIFLLLIGRAYSQTYISITPAFYTTGTGGGSVPQTSTGQRTTIGIEIGKQWDVISLGIDLGKTTLEKNAGNGDINGVIPTGKWYIKLRPNLNVFQQGKFTNTLTIGIGYVFGSKQRMLNEFTTGIEYDPNPNFAYNINYGTYYFTGKGVSSNQVFFGFSIMYFYNYKKHINNNMYNIVWE